MSSEKQTISFEYMKGNLFRTLHADGVSTQITPDLLIQMIVWNERAPIPKKLVYELREDQTLGDLVVEESNIKDSIIREVESVLTIDLETAKNLMNRIGDRIKEIEEMLEETKSV